MKLSFECVVYGFYFLNCRSISKSISQSTKSKDTSVVHSSLSITEILAKRLGDQNIAIDGHEKVIIFKFYVLLSMWAEQIFFNSTSQGTVDVETTDSSNAIGDANKSRKKKGAVRQLKRKRLIAVPSSAGGLRIRIRRTDRNKWVSVSGPIFVLHVYTTQKSV